MSQRPPGETEFQAAERRLGSLRPCGAAKLAGMERSFRDLLESVGEDPERQGLFKTPNRAARASSSSRTYRQSLDVSSRRDLRFRCERDVLVKTRAVFDCASIICCRSSAKPRRLIRTAKSSASQKSLGRGCFARRFQIRTTLTGTSRTHDEEGCTRRGRGGDQANHICMMMRVPGEAKLGQKTRAPGSFKEVGGRRSESARNREPDIDRMLCRAAPKRLEFSARAACSSRALSDAQNVRCVRPGELHARYGTGRKLRRLFCFFRRGRPVTGRSDGNATSGAGGPKFCG